MGGDEKDGGFGFSTSAIWIVYDLLVRQIQSIEHSSVCEQEPKSMIRLSAMNDLVIEGLFFTIGQIRTRLPLIMRTKRIVC